MSGSTAFESELWAGDGVRTNENLLNKRRVSAQLASPTLLSPKAPPGWYAIWLPEDRQYSYCHEASGYVQWGYPDKRKINELDSVWRYDSSNVPNLPDTPPSSPSSKPPSNAVNEYANNPKILTTPNPQGNKPHSILRQLDVRGHWSGKGQHVKFSTDETIPVEQGESLGTGSSAQVDEVMCKGIKLARKQIKCSRRLKLEDVKRELEVLKKLDHRHIITLVGSYRQPRVLGILLYPAAICDLSFYLEELDDVRQNDDLDIGKTMSKLCNRLGVLPSLSSALARLRTTYGCLSAAIQYLHANGIRHKDIKPQNVLLDRDGGLYVADFGLSRDIAGSATSESCGDERGTFKYCAPEAAEYKNRGRRADIYSLGCMFLEINTVCRGFSLADLDAFMFGEGDRSYQSFPKNLREWLSRLRGVPEAYDFGIFDILDVIGRMLAAHPIDRPSMSQVTASLKTLGKDFYFGRCCLGCDEGEAKSLSGPTNGSSHRLREGGSLSNNSGLDRLELEEPRTFADMYRKSDPKLLRTTW